jgi:hypothetical protein
MTNDTFQPPWWLRPATVQTVLASFRPGAKAPDAVTAAARAHIITTAEGVRMLGLLSIHPAKRGLVILLHGWEGSADSTYVRTAARTLYAAGWDIFRLNFRDHGPTHHLNPGIFLAVYLDEVFDAVAQVASGYPGRPVFLAGFSLGGNFGLRVASCCAGRPIANLVRVVAISPVIDPYRATPRIDANPWILWYFRKKWRRSLALKQRLFPDRYDFSDLAADLNLMQMTERLIPYHSPYPTARDYFNGYAVTASIWRRIKVPTTVITSADDPIIPVAHLLELPDNPAVQRLVQRWGGHNGFVNADLTTTWTDAWMARRFEKDQNNPVATAFPVKRWGLPALKRG